ncbi:MAG: hypothetical protein ACPKQO_01045 [Nitrososphaeraceae archaeon]
MKTKILLATPVFITVLLMMGLTSYPLVTKIYAQDYNEYNNLQEDNYLYDYNVKIIPPPGILTAELFQWITDIPREINPLLDETGENCDVDQQGLIWYLVGTPADSQDGDVNVGFAERDCTIPEGKKILIPIIAAACSELTDEEIIREIVGIPEGPIPDMQLEKGLALCAQELIDEVDLLEFSIDGKELTTFEDFRVQSPLFTMSLRADNPFDVPEENAFPGILQKTKSDGYWVLVKGLEPGEHTIEFKRGIAGVSESEITYHLTIEPTNNNKYAGHYDNYYERYYDDNGYDNDYY